MSILRDLARLPLKAVEGTIDLLGYLVFGVPALLIVLAFLMANTWVFWLWGAMAIVSLIVAGVALFRLPSTGSSSNTPGSETGVTSARGVKRPSGGKELLGFTDAWLSENGMFEGKSIDKKAALRIAGQTAVRYHLAQGNFRESEGRLALTARGYSHFMERRARL